MTYLITGVTGGLGKSILDTLGKQVPTSEIAVLVRSVEKGHTFAQAGYDVRIGDYADQVSLEEAFKGIETLMFVSGAPGQAVSREDQHRNVIAAAEKVGVANIVYTSLAKGPASTSILAPDHIVTEELLEQSPMKVKILRNNWYLENELGILEVALATGHFTYGSGQGRVGWALRREYAEAAANALLQPFTGKEIYELSGRLMTYADLYQAFKEATSQDVAEVSLSLQEYQKALADAGTPVEVLGFATAIATDIANGALDVESNDLESLLGKPQVSAVEAIQELLR